jgi:Immunity protein 50
VEAHKQIAGADQLVAVFGYWPSFHDAEVLWLRVDRHFYGDGCYGPTLETLVHAFEMTSEVAADGYYVLRHHVLVHLRFVEVVELRLDGFNCQNALMGLTLTDLRDRQMERVRWSVHFDSAFGVDSSFQCFAVEVLSVVPCSKAGEPMHAGTDVARGR